MTRKKVDHTTIRNSNLFCTHCGRTQVITYPIEIPMMTAMINAFNEIHKSCPPTWKEPVVDQVKSVEEKARWWISNGRVGQSSRTMWNCLIGNKHFEVNHPYDPDDFSRCYILLETVPEWKVDLHKLKTLSPVWSNLVDNWAKLTEMYEENKRTDWKNKKQIGMYDFMQTLIR
jgi:hypothetical protein